MSLLLYAMYEHGVDWTFLVLTALLALIPATDLAAHGAQLGRHAFLSAAPAAKDGYR